MNSFWVGLYPFLLLSTIIFYFVYILFIPVLSNILSVFMSTREKRVSKKVPDICWKKNPLTGSWILTMGGAIQIIEDVDGNIHRWESRGTETGRHNCTHENPGNIFKMNWWFKMNRKSGRIDPKEG